MIPLCSNSEKVLIWINCSWLKIEECRNTFIGQKFKICGSFILNSNQICSALKSTSCEKSKVVYYKRTSPEIVRSGHFPSEAPDWWRARYSHDNMWKYGIWPQHSTVALPEHTRAKHARHVHKMDAVEVASETPPDNTD